MRKLIKAIRNALSDHGDGTNHQWEEAGYWLVRCQCGDFEDTYPDEGPR